MPALGIAPTSIDTLASAWRSGSSQYTVPGVGDRRTFEEIRINDRTETQHYCLSGFQRAVLGEVIGRDHVPDYCDRRCQAVHRGRLVDVGQVTRVRNVEIVVFDADVQRRQRTDVLAVTTYSSVAPGSAAPPLTTDILGDRHLLHIADDNDCWFRPRCRIAVAVGQRVGNFEAVDRLPGS